MSDLRTAAMQALEALKMMRDEYEEYACPACDHADSAIYALRAALAEPVQEPVAWKDKIYESLHHQDFGNSIPLYTAPPQRKPLTEEEIGIICASLGFAQISPVEVARAIERAHGIV